MEEIPVRMAKKLGTGTMVIARPMDVKKIMDRVLAGHLITINEIRKQLAQQYGTDTACPITTGIFAWITAHAAVEELEAGNKATTPYWRTLKQGGEINPKYPGGLQAQISLLEADGHEVIVRGKKVLVKDYQIKLTII